MTTSIFIRSYRNDREWLRYCLRALAKYAKGFCETVVVLPKGDEPHFENFDSHGAKIVWFDDLPGPGYLVAQYSKLMADTFCLGDRILFVDSDAILSKPCIPEDFLDGDKPIHLLGHWSEVGDAICWKDVTKRAVGFEPPFEYMRCLPIIHDRRLFPIIREYMQATHGRSLGEYIQAQPRHEFSEFNVAGVLAHHFLPHLYTWRVANWEYDGYPRYFKQFWSYDGVDKHREELERLVNG